MATHNDSKYTVNSKILDLQSRVGALEKENANLRTHLIEELKRAARETCGKDGRDGVNGVCVCKQGLDGRNGRDGRDGADGQAGAIGPLGMQGRRGEQGERGGKGDKGERGHGDTGLQGIQGERGDVLYIGPDEVAAAVKQVRAELLRLRAAMVGRLVQGIKDNEGTTGGQRLVRMHLQNILRDIENDIAAQEAKAKL